jgi:FkbM family methyltransferase
LRVHLPAGTENAHFCAAWPSVAPQPCAPVDFFVVAQRDNAADKVVDWMLREEVLNMDLVTTLFSRKLPAKCLRADLCVHTASTLSRDQQSKALMLDIGSNHGFYSMQAAALAPWVRVVAFEPQPHCAQYIRIASQANLFSDRVTVLNNLAGTAELAKLDAAGKPLHTLSIPRRTGCYGTWPYLSDSEVERIHNLYAGKEGAFEEVPISYVNPASLVGPDEFVFFAKIDVEGFEEEVFLALEPLIKQRRVHHLMIELNKAQKLRRMGFEDVNDPKLLYENEEMHRWLFTYIRRFIDAGYRFLCVWNGFRTQVRPRAPVWGGEARR